MEAWPNIGKIGIKHTGQTYTPVSDAHSPVGACVTLSLSSSDADTTGGMPQISDNYIKLAQTTMESAYASFTLVAERQSPEVQVTLKRKRERQDHGARDEEQQGRPEVAAGCTNVLSGLRPFPRHWPRDAANLLFGRERPCRT